MEITNELVGNLANLSKLSFDQEGTDEIRNDLQKMVGFIEQLQSVDTNGVEPLLHMGDAVNILRQDQVQGSINREDALLNAPLADEAFFKVPTVIKK
ncbi:MAG: Asp-tRNA(Asn)/Glu-tRNA(Gln) amidotransferase GatCAB subunit C [Chitinophagaceae bacterium BSSC1]|nr:MAG: Asp-tRNA(Asn)/Glu-tRNA(Gln) amidotransferase GatCAB subunit C [Chitinophagaceae bacterium BSSC1]